MAQQIKTKVTRGKPKGDIYYDDIAANYETRRKKQGWWHVEHAEMKALLAQLPDELSVVDIPFGTGRFVPLYRDKAFKIAGLDASGDMISTAKKILGPDFRGIDARVGDAAELPFKDAEFDLLVSTRFLSEIVVYRVARDILKEFSRITRSYAIIQLAQNRQEGFAPEEETPMGGCLSEADTYQLLGDHGFEVMDKRLVKKVDAEDMDIYHYLCRKV